MSSQGYKRTNFEEDDYASNGGSTPPMDFTSTVAFRGKSYGLHLWKKRTNCEKVLAVFVAVLLLHIVIISVLLAFKDSRIGDLKAENKKYCLTPECVNIASTLLTSMDRTLEPCEDFYQYACGGWMKNNPIPSGHSRWGTFDLMWQKNMLVMRNAIDKPDASFTSTAQLKAKKYFVSCMDEDKLIEKAGPRPLLDLISGHAWGVNISEWDHGWQVDSSWQLNRMLEDVHLLNVASFFTLWVAEDDKNSSINVLQHGHLNVSPIEHQHMFFIP